MNNYKERPLLDYLPDVLKEVREFQALMSGEQPETFGLFLEISHGLDNQFVLTANEYGVKRWESILGIVPKATFTLNERRFTIRAKLSEQLPFTYGMLVTMLSQLCGEEGFKLHLEHEEYKIDVKVALTAKNNFDDVGHMLQRIVPANMVIELAIEYNQYQTLGKFTHEQLAAYTHDHLRNEVIS